MAFEHSSVDHPSKLSIVDLSNNQIVSIDNRTFAALPALDVLYLSFNFIQTIETDAFAQNKGLTVLQLSYNQLKTFACQSFEKMKDLDLMSNSLTLFDGNCIGVENYLSLNIEDNRLTNITLSSNFTQLRASSNKLKWITVELNLDTLETLIVSQNRIENIPDIINRLGRALTILDVADNFVGKLNVSTFMKMQNLEELVLRNTSLSNIQYGAFHYQKNLKLLDISFNRLKTIKFEAFSRDVRQLQTFFLDGNNLTQVDGLRKVNFPNVTLIGITENNFTCEYLHEYMGQWTGVTFKADTLLNRSHIDKIVCNEGTEDHNVAGINDNVTEKISIELMTTVIQPVTTVIVQPATRVIEYIDNGSTNRILLVLVLVVLCIICVVVVAKNVILIRGSRRRMSFGNEGNVVYCNETQDNFDGNLVEIIRTDLLYPTD